MPIMQRAVALPVRRRLRGDDAAPACQRYGDERRHPRMGKVMWILLLIQMNASVADLYYVELYETLEQCTADLQEISPRLESHETMLCMAANN
jgi:hypothetical protein